MNDKSLDLKKQLAALKSKDQSFTDWTFVTAFTNSWTNGDPTEVTYAKAGYIKNSAGWVQLCGAITGGSLTATVAFTLPQTFRPRKNYRFPISVGGTTGVGVAEVASTGTVTIFTGSLGLNHFLDSITFRAEN